MKKIKYSVFDVMNEFEYYIMYFGYYFKIEWNKNVILNAQYNVVLGSFPTSHSATVEELHKGEYEVGGGGFIPLEILDTSGRAYIDCFSLFYLRDHLIPFC
jgi:hypothetical protein